MVAELNWRDKLADTIGLMKTRGEWTDARAAGETDLSHKDWYDQKYGGKSAKTQEPPEKTEDEARKQIKAGYDKVAMKRHGLIGRA